MDLYYITDRSQFPGNESHRQRQLLGRIATAARAGMDYIQLREKDLTARELEALARAALQGVQGTRTCLLINSRVDVAIAAGAHGVHLPADDISPSEARSIFAAAGVPKALIAVSCHTADEVRRAHAEGADSIVFGPVFEKAGEKGVGLERLREACSAAPIPVLALGGVIVSGAGECLRAGAKGVAGIRLFQQGDLCATVDALRAQSMAE